MKFETSTAGKMLFASPVIRVTAMYYSFPVLLFCGNAFRLTIQELSNVAHHLLLTRMSRNVHTDNACKLSLIGLMRMYPQWSPYARVQITYVWSRSKR